MKAFKHEFPFYVLKMVGSLSLCLSHFFIMEIVWFDLILIYLLAIRRLMEEATHSMEDLLLVFWITR